MLKYKNYKLIQPNAIQLSRMDELIESNNGSIFHDYDLNNIVKNNFKTKLYYLVDDPNNINVLTPVHVVKNRLGQIKYYFRPVNDIPFAGFVGNEDFDLNQVSFGFFESIQYKGFPFNRENKKNLNNFEIGETAMVDLSIDEEAIFSSVIHSKRRNMIRKAIKSGVIIEKYCSVEGLEKFWPMLDELHKKLGYKQFTFDYYAQILNKFGKCGQAYVLLATEGGIPISGIILVGNKNYMHYYKGASKLGIKDKGQGELLQWEAIKLAKLGGSKYYDLCNLDKDKLPHIYRFKTGISKDIYQYPIYSKSSIGFKLMNRFSKLL